MSNLIDNKYNGLVSLGRDSATAMVIMNEANDLKDLLDTFHHGRECESVKTGLDITCNCYQKDIRDFLKNI